MHAQFYIYLRGDLKKNDTFSFSQYFAKYWPISDCFSPSYSVTSEFGDLSVNWNMSLHYFVKYCQSRADIVVDEESFGRRYITNW